MTNRPYVFVPIEVPLFYARRYTERVIAVQLHWTLRLISFIICLIVVVRSYLAPIGPFDLHHSALLAVPIQYLLYTLLLLLLELKIFSVQLL